MAQLPEEELDELDELGELTLTASVFWEEGALVPMGVLDMHEAGCFWNESDGILFPPREAQNVSRDVGDRAHDVHVGSRCHKGGGGERAVFLLYTKMKNRSYHLDIKIRYARRGKIPSSPVHLQREK